MPVTPDGLVQVRRQIGFIFQLHNLLEFLTARQNVQMALQLHAELCRAEIEDRAGEMLERRRAGKLEGLVSGQPVGRREAAGIDRPGAG